MKSFITFVNKEFYHIFRDRRTLLILLGLPVLQLVLFGFAITTEVRNVKIGVLDMSKDISTQRIINQLVSSEYFTLFQNINHPDEIEAALKKGDIKMAIVFGENFNEGLLHTGEASVQLITDATDPNQAVLLSSYAANTLAGYQQELLQKHIIPFSIIPEISMLYNPQMKGAYNFVPGVMGLILMLICAMMTSIAIVREKESGTMEILLVSPMKPILIIMAKVVPYFILSVINLTTILLLSVFVLDVPIAGSLFWLTVVSFIFILTALALGLFISTIANTQVTAIIVSGMGLMIPVMLLSGLLFPVESMPKVLQGLASITPARWYIAAVRKLMIQGSDIVFVLKEIGILCLMAGFLLAVSLKKFKIRLA
jgi:ABC-2 type transport system permease protein